MIFTECPYCDEPQVFGWEAGMPNGWFPSKCHNCKEVMWVEAAYIDGTTITHEEFKEMINKKLPYIDDLRLEMMKAEAVNRSNVIYDELGDQS